jgi:MFS family permease
MKMHFSVAGMFISAVFWGMIADKYGRRPTLILTSVFLCYFGFLTSFAPTYEWIVFIRFLVGFFIGGIPQVGRLLAYFIGLAQML